MSKKSKLSRSEAQKARREREKAFRPPKAKKKRKPLTPEQKAARAQRVRDRRAQISPANTKCSTCGDRISFCRDRTKSCSSCGQNIAICTEAQHQKSLYCHAATAARIPKERGLVRCQSEGLLTMLNEAGVPYEQHPSRVACPKDLTELERKRRKIQRGGGNAILIVDEAWIPPEALEIVQADRTLADRMQALRNLAAWQRTG